jgi:hypothetical protein
MKIITKSEAKALGLQFFYTGKPCKRGHDVAWPVKTGTCPACTKLANQRHYASNPLRITYTAMRQRCYNTNNEFYHRYGGRGITVCDRWLDPSTGYAAFVADMGPRPARFSLDRINSDGNYDPSNCRWASAKTQTRNRSNTKISDADIYRVRGLLSEGLTQKQVAAMFNCAQGSIAYCVKHNAY